MAYDTLRNVLFCEISAKLIFCEINSKNTCILRNKIFDKVRNFGSKNHYFEKRAISSLIKYDLRNKFSPVLFTTYSFVVHIEGGCQCRWLLSCFVEYF